MPFDVITHSRKANGNVTQAGTPTYGYDALNRINAENPGTAASYTYDATDNRLTKVSGSTTTTTVPSTSNKISAVGAASYTYDAAGNITNDGTNAYTWNAAAQLATVNTTGGVYTYNVNNQRTKKVAGGTTTYYVYGAGGLLTGEYSTAGALIREYVYLNGEPLAQIDAGSPQVLTYLHTDHLGTPRYATNAAGTQVWSWTADAFGTSTPTGTATVNLRMPGQYYDAESTLFYNWNRYYKPSIGRYISSDPIGLAGGLNTFSYVGQNPVMFTDVEGLAYGWWDFQGDLANAQIQGLQGLAGLTDSLTWGASQTYRQQNGLEYADTCSVSYTSGNIFGTGIGFVGTGSALTKGAASLEITALKQAFGQSSLLFKRGTGLLNSNNYLRIGWNWKGPFDTGRDVFRIAIGNKDSWIHWHWTLW